MKKLLITNLIVLSISIPYISSAQSVDVDTSNDASCAIITTNLRYGSTDIKTGGSVSVLQDFLNTNGYLTSQPTGFFGSMTRSAVRAFQNANNIPANPPGFVGSLTRAKIQEIDCGNNSAQTTSPLNTVTKAAPQTTNQVQKKVFISKIDSAGNPVGTITANEKASIHGIGLSGEITIKIGNQEPQIVKVTGVSDSYAEFIVPSRTQAATVSITVTNSFNMKSNFYQVNIDVPKKEIPPTISSIQSPTNNEGTVDAGRKAFIYGTGLKGKLIIKIGNQEPQTVTVDNNSETSAEFIVPSRVQSSIVDISVTNDSNQTSNSYQTNIDVFN